MDSQELGLCLAPNLHVIVDVVTKTTNVAGWHIGRKDKIYFHFSMPYHVPTNTFPMDPFVIGRTLTFTLNMPFYILAKYFPVDLLNCHKED